MNEAMIRVLECDAACIRTAGGVTTAGCRRCSWHREFGKEQNAITRLAEHLMVKHRVKLVLPEYKEWKEAR